MDGTSICEAIVRAGIAGPKVLTDASALAGSPHDSEPLLSGERSARIDRPEAENLQPNGDAKPTRFIRMATAAMLLACLIGAGFATVAVSQTVLAPTLTRPDWVLTRGR